MKRSINLCFGLLIGLCAAASAQQPTQDPAARLVKPKAVALGGPRVGLTVLSGESYRVAREDHGLTRSVVSQFGWQFERSFSTGDNGPTGIFEWVLLVGGLDQGKVFPSISWITGLRSAGGVEFGAGPNVTPIGFAFAIAGGYSIPAGYMNFPVTVALVSSATGVRTTALVGFTTRR